MRDVWLKLRMLRFYKLDVRAWLTAVWRQDSNARICCNGYMCDCDGECHYEYWHYLLGDKLGKG